MDSLGIKKDGRYLLTDCDLTTDGNTVITMGEPMETDGWIVGESLRSVLLSPADRLMLIHLLTGHAIGIEPDDYQGTE